MNVRSFDFYIADMDGTLVDTSLDFAGMRREIGIPDGEDILSFIVKLAAAEQAEAMAIIDRFEVEGADRAKLLPGVAEFMDWIRSQGAPFAILTRNSRLVTDRLVSRFAIPVAFTCTREDAAPKPNPAGLELLLQGAGVPANRAVYIGDYLYDLEAAEAAKMPFILFHQNEAPSYASRAQFVMNDFRKLIDWLELPK